MKNIFSLFAVTFVLVFVTGCGEENPREAFREKLGENIDKLIYKLGYLGTDAQERVETNISYDGKSRDSTMMIPKSAGIKGTVTEIHRMFTGPEFTLLNQDIAGFDQWGAALKEDISSYQARLENKTDQLIKRLENTPAKDDSNFITSLVNMAGQVKHDHKGELYVLVGTGQSRGRYFPKKTFQIDIDDWLAGIKRDSRKFQTFEENGNPYSLEKRTFLYISSFAEDGNARAQFDLARKYLNGDGVESDIIRAYKWASLSRKNGFTQANQLENWIKGLIKKDQLEQAKEMAEDWLMKHKTPKE